MRAGWPPDARTGRCTMQLSCAERRRLVVPSLTPIMGPPPCLRAGPVRCASRPARRAQAGSKLTASFGAAPALGAAFDSLADFSSKGPTRDGRIKPDLLAPGTMQSAYTDPLGNTCGLRCALLQHLAETRPQVAPDRTASAAGAASASAHSSAPATAAASGRTQSGLIDCRCSLRSRPPATPARQAPAARAPRDKLPLVCSACACQRAASACASCRVALDFVVRYMPAHATRSLRAACVRQACA